MRPLIMGGLYVIERHAVPLAQMLLLIQPEQLGPWLAAICMTPCLSSDVTAVGRSTVLVVVLVGHAVVAVLVVLVVRLVVLVVAVMERV